MMYDPHIFVDHWCETLMNISVQLLIEHDAFSRSVNIGVWHHVPSRWLFAGEGVTLWRESDGHSPVEPSRDFTVLFQENVHDDQVH